MFPLILSYQMTSEGCEFLFTPNHAKIKIHFLDTKNETNVWYRYCRIRSFIWVCNISHFILASGLLVSLYLILYGVYSFSGWGDRIANANQIAEDHEGRGTIQFLFIMYLGPLISIIWGMGIFALVKRVLRTGSVWLYEIHATKPQLFQTPQK